MNTKQTLAVTGDVDYWYGKLVKAEALNAELLAALREIAEETIPDAGKAGVVTAPEQRFYDAVRLARAAIAKAEQP